MALTQNQQKAIAALLSSPSREEAARKCGLTSRTLRAYFQNNEFCEAYRSAFQERQKMQRDRRSAYYLRRLIRWKRS